MKAAIPLFSRLFPGLKIVQHDKVESPENWHKQHPNNAQKMSRLEAESSSDKALADIANGKRFGVLHNEKFGEIQYPLGKMGTIGANGKTKGGSEFLHIVAERMRKDGATIEEAIEIARRVGVAASIGTETKSVMNTHWLDYDGVRAIIAVTDKGIPIITGYEIRADGDSAAFPPSERLQPHPVVREDEIVAALKDANNIAHSAENGNSLRLIVSKKSDETLGWYSPDTKEIHLNPGADAEALMHEALHAVQDCANAGARERIIWVKNKKKMINDF